MTRSRIADTAASVIGLAGLLTMAFVDAKLGAALFAAAAACLLVRPAATLWRRKRAVDPVKPEEFGC